MPMTAYDNDWGAPYRRDGSIERLLCHASDSADDRFAAVVTRSSRRLTR